MKCEFGSGDQQIGSKALFRDHHLLLCPILTWPYAGAKTSFRIMAENMEVIYKQNTSFEFEFYEGWDKVVLSPISGTLEGPLSGGTGSGTA